MRDVAIVAGIRTPFGRALKGNLKDTRPDDLAIMVCKELLLRANVRASDIEDVILGCAMPEGEQGMNVARIAVLGAGMPVEVPGITVNRFCASGLESMAMLADRIGMGRIDTGIAGGVESMSMVPMVGNKLSLNPQIVETYPEVYLPMGITAENVASKFGISRKDQDRFSFQSHQRALRAAEEGMFSKEVMPITVKVFNDAGPTWVTVDKDECPRSDTDLLKLAALRPAFDPTGTVTAGNSSPLTDGAAATLMMSAERAHAKGLPVLGYFRHMVVTGVAPELMGIGPVPAVQKLLARTGLSIDQIDLFEVNEAFASQAIYCARTIGIPNEKLNVNGGAIAIGHPLGVTGTRLAITILHELQRRKGRYGVVSMCIGGGMGAAALLEVASSL